MKTIGVVALSINKGIYESMFRETFHFLNENDDIYKEEYVIKGVVFAQGFDAEGTDDITVIRDDSHLMKLGYSISEIREYFTGRVLKEFNFDYVVFTDDDFKFRIRSGVSIKEMAYMLDHDRRSRDVGLVNFKMSNSFESGDINPTFVYMRGGIMIRPEAYDGWGGEYKCIYYEEAILATKIYVKGYRVITTCTDVIHRTNQSGLGKSLEAKYADKFNTMPGGRQILCNNYKLAKPSCDHKSGIGVPNYRKPCKLTKETIEIHKSRNKEILK